MGAEPSSRLEGKIPSGWLPISHAESILSTADLKLAALCDSDKDRLDRFSTYYKVEKKYLDYNDLLNSEVTDLLSIATRTAGRCEVIRKAVKKGIKAIYAEKPLSTSLIETKSTLDTVKLAGAVLGYGVNRRYHAVYRKAKEMILSGEIGDVVEIVIEAGYAPLLWSHPHSSDLMIFFAGTTKIEFVQGGCQKLEWNPQTSIVDSDPMVGNSFVQFGNGVSGTINKASGLNVRIAGSTANLTVHADGSFIELYRHSKATPYYFDIRGEEKPAAKCSATQQVFNELKDSLKGKSFQGISPEEIFAGQQILFATVQSSLEGGRRIKADEMNMDMIITGKSGNFYA